MTARDTVSGSGSRPRAHTHEADTEGLSRAVTLSLEQRLSCNPLAYTRVTGPSWGYSTTGWHRPDISLASES